MNRLNRLSPFGKERLVIDNLIHFSDAAIDKTHRCRAWHEARCWVVGLETGSPPPQKKENSDFTVVDSFRLKKIVHQKKSIKRSKRMEFEKERQKEVKCKEIKINKEIT